MARLYDATAAKNQFGKVLRAAEEEPVYLVKHGKTTAVILSIEAFDKLAAGPAPDDARTRALAEARRAFDELAAGMQTKRWKKGVDRLLTVSAGGFNAVAAKGIRARAKTRR